MIRKHKKFSSSSNPSEIISEIVELFKENVRYRENAMEVIDMDDDDGEFIRMAPPYEIEEAVSDDPYIHFIEDICCLMTGNEQILRLHCIKDERERREGYSMGYVIDLEMCKDVNALVELYEGVYWCYLNENEESK